MASAILPKENEEIDWFSTFDHLGSFYPFCLTDRNDRYSNCFSKIIQEIPVGERYLDPVGVCEILNRGHMFGNRTLVEGIQRAPWMARPAGGGRWDFAPLPRHGKRKPSWQEFIPELKACLRTEVSGYVQGRRTVGVLLSGGLDSRIVAGTLRELQLSGDFTGDVIGFTWGEKDSRDACYASQIASRFQWCWERISLGPEVLRENILATSKMGAEFAPFHLHALPAVLGFSGIDAFLAGNYGDSIGRGEFSGTYLRNLGTMVPKNLNPFGLLKQSVIDEVSEFIKKDVYAYRKYISRDEEYQYREIEYQMHCIRRRSQAVMSFIGGSVPLYQVFSHPQTFSLIWELDPEMRDARLYEHLLPTFPGDLADIPWARTGVPFGANAAGKDGLSKEHHRYGVWLRKNLKPYVTSLILDRDIQSLELFNRGVIERLLLKVWPNSETVTINRLDEIFAWLAAFSLFIERYRISEKKNKFRSSPRDFTNGLSGHAYALLYQTVRNKLRR